jgi:hypothetical protein
MLLAEGSSADSAKAGALLASAQATCAELGMTALGAKVTGLLDETQVSLPHP